MPFAKTYVISDTELAKQAVGKLARRTLINDIVQKLNLVLQAEGRGGIVVEVSGGNIVISLDPSLTQITGEVVETEVTVCRLVDDQPTAQDVIFLTRPIEEDEE